MRGPAILQNGSHMDFAPPVVVGGDEVEESFPTTESTPNHSSGIRLCRNSAAECASLILEEAKSYLTGSDGRQRDLARAFNHFNHASRMGSVEAKYNAALFYRGGLGIAKNLHKFHSTLYQAHELANRSLESKFSSPRRFDQIRGVSYFEGSGVKKDAVAAAELFCEAMNGGAKGASTNLALLLLFSIYEAREKLLVLDEILQSIERSGQSGSETTGASSPPESFSRASRLHREGMATWDLSERLRTANSLGVGFKALDLLASLRGLVLDSLWHDQTDANVFFNLAVAHELADEVAEGPRLVEATRLYTLADKSAGGYPPAQLALGKLYLRKLLAVESNCHLKSDHELLAEDEYRIHGLAWLQRAAENGEAEAQAIWSSIYREGAFDVDVDEEESFRCIEMAIDNGWCPPGQSTTVASLLSIKPSFQASLPHFFDEPPFEYEEFSSVLPERGFDSFPDTSSSDEGLIQSITEAKFVPTLSRSCSRRSTAGPRLSGNVASNETRRKFMAVAVPPVGSRRSVFNTSLVVRGEGDMKQLQNGSVDEEEKLCPNQEPDSGDWPRNESEILQELRRQLASNGGGDTTVSTRIPGTASADAYREDHLDLRATKSCRTDGAAAVNGVYVNVGYSKGGKGSIAIRDFSTCRRFTATFEEEKTSRRPSRSLPVVDQLWTRMQVALGLDDLQRLSRTRPIQIMIKAFRLHQSSLELFARKAPVAEWMRQLGESYALYPSEHFRLEPYGFEAAIDDAAIQFESNTTSEESDLAMYVVLSRHLMQSKFLSTYRTSPAAPESSSVPLRVHGCLTRSHSMIERRKANEPRSVQGTTPVRLWHLLLLRARLRFHVQRFVEAAWYDLQLAWDYCPQEFRYHLEYSQLELCLANPQPQGVEVLPPPIQRNRSKKGAAIIANHNSLVAILERYVDHVPPEDLRPIGHFAEVLLSMPNLDRNRIELAMQRWYFKREQQPPSLRLSLSVPAPLWKIPL